MKKPAATKGSTSKPSASDRHPTLNLAEIARIIGGAKTPRWLPAHLEWWSQGIRRDILFDQIRPSKRETVERLLSVEQAATLLQRELDNPSIRNLLQAASPSAHIRVSIADIKDLIERAEIAKSSSTLVGKSGKTKRGRGKPAVPDLFDAKMLCASRIFEAWRFIRKREPGISNLKLAEAAQAYWVGSGGKSSGPGDPRNGWFDYFKAVRDNEMSPGLKRLIWRRDLEQCEQRGRPPWFLGTYFPYPET